MVPRIEAGRDKYRHRTSTDLGVLGMMMSSREREVPQL